MILIVEYFDEEVVELLLNQQAAWIQITHEVARVAIRNLGSSKQVVRLLLNQQMKGVRVSKEATLILHKNL